MRATNHSSSSIQSKMLLISFIVLIVSGLEFISGQVLEIFESDVKFRVDAGTQTCFYELGKAGQTLETQYKVVDGQHGDLDISFTITDPKGKLLLDDHKQSENVVMIPLEIGGAYMFCMDNSHSMVNSKLVFVYVLFEDQNSDEEVTVAVENESGEEKEKEVLEWMGYYENGEPYYIEINDIAESLTRTLKHVIGARHLLTMRGAARARDNYSAFKDTFIVDVWSTFQITCMVLVGLVQVYMIKKLFSRPVSRLNYGI